MCTVVLFDINNTHNIKQFWFSISLRRNRSEAMPSCPFSAPSQRHSFGEPSLAASCLSKAPQTTESSSTKMRSHHRSPQPLHIRRKNAATNAASAHPIRQAPSPRAVEILRYFY